ncbi:lytic transglycosylase domain-containing protein [Pseudozobellia thermophila]|uniref:Membrane-bound lytic murein transglycosylase D n=1 Tax=Pseudozobellia thermophila TaxID=192903 RepID=A0A1M6BKD0_9FLAO|nr:lytic transglycosylase domain-containing protein [Pseudozobellia thermophila]SHI49126.1 membrane-bound lytic murein transglycosylase D [Pseudozobellia thermophila]
MIRTRFGFLVLLAGFFCAVPIWAQQKDSLLVAQKDSLLALNQEVGEDTLAMDMKGVQLMERMAADSTELGDTSLSLIIDKVSRKYNLKDHSEAARYDSLWMKELAANASLSEEMFNEVEGIDFERTYPTSLSTDTLKARLARLNEKTPFNVEYNPSLENVIKSFLFRKRELMERMLTASQFYFPLFEQELDNYNIPLEMKYLSIVESALNPRARSRVGATGLWQFMYGTGRQYKLNISSYVDERSDPIKSTKAACQFLSKLYEIYGDWDLALAAYNSGPGNVNKAIRRSGGQKNYWNLRRFLPRETAGYVPAFLATMYLFEYAEEHGLKGQKVERPYFETDTVHVKALITFDQISELLEVSKEELMVLNPSYKLNVIPYIEGKTHALRLPKDVIGKFVANEEAIYEHVKKELESKESPLPQLVKQAEQNQIRYKVRSGDYLGKIAERYGVGVSQIKRWNGLRSNNLRVGQRLTIFPRRNPGAAVASSATTSSSQSFPPGTKTHTVRSGDSLWTISRKYPGITVENLRKWNGISGKNLKPGTKLKLCECSS